MNLKMPTLSELIIGVPIPFAILVAWAVLA